MQMPQLWSQIVLLLCCSGANAAGGLFDSDEVLELELHGPLRETLRDTEHREERPFVARLGELNLDVAVRVRGKSRAQACHFPPLRLDFSAASAAGTPFAGQGALKLVTHCKEAYSYAQNVFEEYAAYRIFQLFSGTAFRVRPLRIRYVDTDRPDLDAPWRHAFLIESKRELARRTGGTFVEAEYVYTGDLNRQQTSAVFVFQFLIGNTDWSLVKANGADHCCHNGELLALDGEHHYVPYDFDQAGIVNARYAKPHPGLGLRTVRTRRYRGNCVSGLELEEAVRAARDLEGDIRALVTGLPDSTEKLERSRQRYLGEFFDAARNPAELAADFQRRCLD